MELAGNEQLGRSRWSAANIRLAVLGGAIGLQLLLSAAYWIVGSAGVALPRAVALVLCGVLAAVYLVAIAADGSVRGVARQTFLQCIRMRLGVVFIVVLAVVIAVIPLLIQTQRGSDWATLSAKGDDMTMPLADRIRTFLSYSTVAVMVILSLLTIFVGAGLISSDVEKKRIFLLAAKPLAKWQYVLGRWLGLVMLDAILLAASAVAIYTYAQYMRQQVHNGPDDRRAIETEVFAARATISPDLTQREANIRKAVEADILKMQKEGRLQPALDEKKAMLGYLPPKEADELAKTGLIADIRKNYDIQSCGPGGQLIWAFKDIHVSDPGLEGEGTVSEVHAPDGRLWVKVGYEMIGRLMFAAPIRVNNVEGRVLDLAENEFQVGFTKAGGAFLSGLKKGDAVKVKADPLLQITYKPQPSLAPPDGTCASFWEATWPPPADATDASKAVFCFAQREDKANSSATITMSALAADPQGRMVVRFMNLENVSVTINNTDISVLYRTGSFEGNFLRGMVFVLVQLAFVAALSVAAGSFVGWAVACLLVIVLMPFAFWRTWLTESVEGLQMVGSPWFFPTSLGSLGTWLSEFGAWAFAALIRTIAHLMQLVLPDLERLSPSDNFVSGQVIPWDLSNLGVLWYSVLGMAIVLGVACLVFRKRELARVQV